MNAAMLLTKRKSAQPVFVKVPANNINDLVNGIFPGATQTFPYTQAIGECHGHAFFLPIPIYKPVYAKYLGDGQFESVLDTSAVTNYQAPNACGDEMVYSVVIGGAYRIAKKKLEEHSAVLLPANPSMNQGYTPIIKHNDTYFLRANVAGTMKLASSLDLMTFTGGFPNASGDIVAPTVLNTLDGDTIVEAINGVNNLRLITARNKVTGNTLYNETDSSYNSGFMQVTTKDADNIYFFRGSGQLHIYNRNNTLKTYRLTAAPYDPAYTVYQMFAVNGSLYLFATGSIWKFTNGVFENIPMPSWMAWCRGAFMYEGKFVLLYVESSSDTITKVADMII